MMELSLGLSLGAQLPKGDHDADVPSGSSDVSIFGFSYPSSQPDSYGEDLLTPEQASLDDDSKIAIQASEPAFTITDGQLVTDGSNTRTRAVRQNTGETTAAGRVYSLVAHVSSFSGTGDFNPNMPGVSSTSATRDDVANYAASFEATDERNVNIGVRIAPDTIATVEELHALDLSVLTQDKPSSVVLFAGQSNMIGNNAGYDRSLHPHVKGAYVLPGRQNRSKGAEYNGGLPVPLPALEPIQHGTSSDGAGPVGAFLRELRKHIPSDQSLCGVPLAWAGAGFKDNDDWHKDGSNPQAYNAFWDAANSAVSRTQAWNAGSYVSAIVWCGGESDFGATWDGGGNAAVHIERLHAFLLEVRAAFGSDIPIVIMSVGGNYDTADATRFENISNMEDTHRQLATGSGNALYELPNCVYVERPSAPGWADDTHFDEATNIVRGRQAAGAAANLMYPDRLIIAP